MITAKVQGNMSSSYWDTVLYCTITCTIIVYIIIIKVGVVVKKIKGGRSA